MKRKVFLIIICAWCAFYGFADAKFHSILQQRLTSLLKLGKVNLKEEKEIKFNELKPIISTKHKLFGGMASFELSNFLSKNEIEILRETGIRALQNLSQLFVYYMAFRLFFSHLKFSIQSITEALRRDSIGSGGGSFGPLTNEMKQFIPSNVTLSDDEMRIVSTIKFPSEITENWKYLGGLSGVKRELNSLRNKATESTKLSNTRLIAPRRSVLLYGPPGCGKTELVRGLAKHWNIPMMEILPSNIKSKWYGESTRNVRALLTLAKKFTSMIIFVDEIDALLGSRRELDHEYDRSVKTELMQLWDEISRDPNLDIYFIGASNRPQDIDAAVLRRFEKSFLLSLPNFEQRQEIFKRILHGVKKAKGFDFSQCAQMTEGYSGSDIFGLCKQVISSNPNVLTNQEIETALQTYVPTTWAANAYDIQSQPYFNFPTPNMPSDWNVNQNDKSTPFDDHDDEDD